MIGPGAPLDLAFLEAQTFGDPALQREILNLFLAQSKRLAPDMENLCPAEQTATAHLLKGSCLGIGAAPLAELLQRYGSSDPIGRRGLDAELRSAFSRLEAAIEARIALL